MKMKLGEVQIRLQGLINIAGKKFPAKVGYAIMRNERELESEYKDLDTQRIKICESYAEKDSDGKALVKDGKYVFSENNQAVCNKEYKELMDEEIEVDIHTVDVTELDKCDENGRYDVPTAADYMAMDFMFKRKENGL